MIKYKKLKVKDKKNSPLVRWLTFLDKDSSEDELEEVIQMDAAINRANERLYFVSQDQEFMRAYEVREKALHDQTTIVNTATEKGIEKGIEKGKIGVAKSLLSDGITFELIQKHTGLDIETIKSLG